MEGHKTLIKLAVEEFKTRPLEGANLSLQIMYTDH